MSVANGPNDASAGPRGSRSEPASGVTGTRDRSAALPGPFGTSRVHPTAGDQAALMGLPLLSVVIWDSWFETGDPSYGSTSTGVPTPAQAYTQPARACGTWMQPWLRVPSENCDPGPSVESGCQFASWMASPVTVKNVAYCTTVAGYQNGD